MKLKIHRGDYYSGQIVFKNKTGDILDYPFSEIYLTVKLDEETKDFLFQKRLSRDEIQKIESGTYIFEIQPEDTNELNYGDYGFDIEVVCNEPRIKKTFTGMLTLEKEYTFYTNED